MSTEAKAPRTLFGIPVHGDFHGEPKIAQKPIEDLFPLVKALLDDKTITEFGWQQYIPGFNDGEPCVFGTSGLFAKVAVPQDADEDDEDDYGHDGWDRDGGGNYDRYIGENSYHLEYLQDDGTWAPQWSRRGSRRIKDVYTGPDEARRDRIEALMSAIDSGAFDFALEEKFGYNVEITFVNHADPGQIKIVLDEYDCGY